MANRETMWTEAQDAAVRKAYLGKVPLADIASQLGRSEEAVRRRATKLGMMRIPMGYDSILGCCEAMRCEPDLLYRAMKYCEYTPERMPSWGKKGNGRGRVVLSRDLAKAMVRRYLDSGPSRSS